MCLILFAYHSHPTYKLIFAANRDEFYQRPTATAHWWEDNSSILGGRDLVAGGSWLGIHTNGKIAALTNIREPDNVKSVAPSRGDLVKDFLMESYNSQQYSGKLVEESNAYNGFNLLYGYIDELFYYSNRNGTPQKLVPGIYGLSNDQLETPWPKVVKGKQKLLQFMHETESDTYDVISWLHDPSLAPDTQLPSTGVPLEWERTLSAMFIKSPKYGTRASTVILIDHHNQVTFHERSYIPSSNQKFEFTLAYALT